MKYWRTPMWFAPRVLLRWTGEFETTNSGKCWLMNLPKLLSLRPWSLFWRGPSMSSWLGITASLDLWSCAKRLPKLGSTKVYLNGSFVLASDRSASKCSTGCTHVYPTSPQWLSTKARCKTAFQNKTASSKGLRSHGLNKRNQCFSTTPTLAKRYQLQEHRSLTELRLPTSSKLSLTFSMRAWDQTKSESSHPMKARKHLSNRTCRSKAR